MLHDWLQTCKERHQLVLSQYRPHGNSMMSALYETFQVSDLSHHSFQIQTSLKVHELLQHWQQKLSAK